MKNVLSLGWRRRVLTVMGLLLAAVGCQGPAAARVGRQTVSPLRLKQRVALDRIMSDKQPDTVAALLTVVNEALIEQVSRAYRYPLPDSLVRQESARIERETEVPEKLAQIKQVFAGTRDYNSHYVRPIIAERMLRVKYYSDTIIQHPTLNRVRQAWSDYRAGRPVDTAVRRAKLPDDTLGRAFAGQDVRQSMYSYFFIEEEGDSLVLFSLDKPDFRHWFEVQAYAFPVTILDSGLRARVTEATREADFWHRLIR